VSDNRHVLSDAQFANLLGGSREIATGKQGKGSGYYVSRDPRMPVEMGGSKETVGGLADVGKVREHLEAIKGKAEKVMPTGWMQARSATPTESANVHQGIWQDEESKKTYLDVSDRVGGRASRKSLAEGLSRGIEQKQLAIYAAGSGRVLPTNTEDKFGTKTPNPAAEMTLNYLNKQNAESAARRKMSRGAKMKEKKEALAAFDTAFPRKK
jgi:hypothetical protein